MAPLRPLPSKADAPPRSILKQKSNGQSAKPSAESAFASSKKDKRRIKHAQLLSKVTKSVPGKSRRRRPNKKLVTTLDALADALPDNDEVPGSEKVAGTNVADQVNVIKRKSMKSKPGAMKRKQKLDNEERDRFAKNLAQMAAPASTTGPATASEKLKALRGFISQTLEKRPEVAGVGG